MTSQVENDLLTRVGPGTPMGALMRQYWLPACLSSELVADGDPLRLMLLGERLIGFRDSDGRVGVLDHRCVTAAPRCSSAATRKAACAVFITAGNTTSPGIASICPICPQTRTSGKR